MRKRGYTNAKPGNALVLAQNNGQLTGVIASWQFSTSTTASDPGDGYVRFNNVAPASVTAIYIDNLDGQDNPLAAWLDTLTAGAQIAFRSANSLTQFVIYTVVSVTDSTGFRTVAVTWLAGLPAFLADEPLAVSAALAGAIPASVREKISANRTYYVRPDGNDSNPGWPDTSGGAKLTIQAAILAAAALDGSTFDVKVKVAPGAWTVPVVLPNYIGSGTWTLEGDTATPSNVTLNVTGTAISAANVPVPWVVDGFRVIATQDGIQANNATINYKNIDFGTCGSAHNHALIDAKMNQIGPCSISGGAADHCFCEIESIWGPLGQTITISTPVTITRFANAQALSAIRAGGMTFTNKANVTGQRYLSEGNSRIGTGGGGASYFPGTTAGGEATGGIYA